MKRKKRRILLEYDEVTFWEIHDLKMLINGKVGRNVSWNDLVYSAITGKPLKTMQQLLEEADRITERKVKEHNGKD